MYFERHVEAFWLVEKAINVRKIDEVRNTDGAPAVFLRYARSE
jgi:hypothetical protein